LARVFTFVIPAKAGIQWAVVIAGRWMRRLDSRLRGNDEIMGLCAFKEGLIFTFDTNPHRNSRRQGEQE